MQGCGTISFVLYAKTVHCMVCGFHCLADPTDLLQISLITAVEQHQRSHIFVDHSRSALGSALCTALHLFH